MNNVTIQYISPRIGDIYKPFVDADEDKPEYIDFCLHHCPYASTECCNCLATAGKAKPGRPRKTEYI